MNIKAYQVVKAGVVVDAVLADAGALIANGGSRLEWATDGIDAPEGGTFADVEGAQIGWLAEGAMLMPPPAPVETAEMVEAAKALAIGQVHAFSAGKRRILSGASDPYKAAVYNQRAAYGRLILDGSASEAMLAVARSEAVRIGLAGSIEAADPMAIAAVWRDLDERLALLSAQLDMIENEAVASIERRRSVDGVGEALGLALADAEARIAAAVERA